jgi:Caspase domain
LRFPDPQRSRVVLIGTSSYHDVNLPDLPQVRANIADLANTMSASPGGIVSNVNCEVITDEGDLRQIGRKLRGAARQADDLLLVYFAGHGLTGSKRHDLYLGLPDSEWADPEFNSLEFDKLRSAVLDSPACSKVIILDCCFSGRAVTESQAGGAALIGQLEVDGTYVLTASHRDQVALIVPGEAHTAFTGRMLKLFREGIRNGPKLLTVEDIYQALRVTMQAEGLSIPQKRATGNAGLLALAYNQAFAEAAPHGPHVFNQTADLPFRGDTVEYLSRTVCPRIEAQYQVRIGADAVIACATLSEQLPGPQPSKALGLLSEAVALLLNRGDVPHTPDLRSLDDEIDRIREQIGDLDAESGGDDWTASLRDIESELQDERDALLKDLKSRVTEDLVAEAFKIVLGPPTQD